MENKSESEVSGAKQVVAVNQKTPATIYVDGFYKTSDVSGDSDQHIGVKAIIKYADESIKQLHYNFTTGSHDWENFKLQIEKDNSPVKEISVEFLLQNHSGNFLDL